MPSEGNFEWLTLSWFLALYLRSMNLRPLALTVLPALDALLRTRGLFPLPCFPLPFPHRTVDTMQICTTSKLTSATQHELGSKLLQAIDLHHCTVVCSGQSERKCGVSRRLGILIQALGIVSLAR